MKSAQSSRTSRLFALTSAAAAHTAGWAANVAKNALIHHHAVQQREEHGLLGGEVEVERRPGQARALGQVVDRDVGELAGLQQPFGGAQDGSLAVLTGRAGRSTTAA
jgi:hypothetical protein